MGKTLAKITKNGTKKSKAIGRKFSLSFGGFYHIKGFEDGDIIADQYDSEGFLISKKVPLDRNIHSFDKELSKPNLARRFVTWTLNKTIYKCLPQEWEYENRKKH